MSPVIPVFLYYRTLTTGGGSFSPVWRNLESPFSIISWLSQISMADPFIIISRKTLPFVNADSNFFLVFAPLLWLATALILMAAASLRRSDGDDWKSRLPFALLFVGALLAAMFAPDDFGLTNGSVLRERVLLCGLIFFVPLFRLQSSPVLKRLAQTALVFVIVFQTAALWEYALKTDREARNYYSVSSVINEHDSIFPVVLSDESRRLHSLPMTGMGNYLGIGRDIAVWNNYEIGHRLFPIVAKNEADRRFMFEFPSAAVNLSNNSGESLDEKMLKMESSLGTYHDKINILLIWNSDPLVEPVFAKWFAPEPFFSNGQIRLFRHR
jgi:hypothetical protein